MMSFTVVALLLLSPQSVEKALAHSRLRTCYGNDQSGTNTTCGVDINGTACLVCPTPSTDVSFSWYCGDNRIFRYTHRTPGDIVGCQHHNYKVGCHKSMYSLRVVTTGFQRGNTFYQCENQSSTHIFILKTSEIPHATIEKTGAEDSDDRIIQCTFSRLVSAVNLTWLIDDVEEDSAFLNVSAREIYDHTSNISVPSSNRDKEVTCKVSGPHITTTNKTIVIDGDDNGSNLERERTGGVVALYIIVPCLFIASMVTSLFLYHKAKHSRHRKFEARRKSDQMVNTTTLNEGQYDGEVYVYSDITKEDDKHVANLATSSSVTATTLISRLATSGMFDYWSATYINESDEEQKCFAKALSSVATMKDATTFQDLALSLKSLPENIFLVQILCVSVEELPYSIFYEYMECGSLRDFMLRRYQQARESRMSLSIENPEILPATVKTQIEELLTFALMIAEALKFISSQKFCHPCLSLKKVLLSEYCECKLYDIYPTEMAMTRVNDLTNKDHPPTAWMAVETIFLQEYQTTSDVWSFAVLLWELFSLGEVPFARNTRQEVEQKIRDGVVLTQPLCCPGAIYGIMLSCWNNSARKRPTFESLVNKLRSLVEKFKQQGQRCTTTGLQEGMEIPYFVLDPNAASNNYI